MSINTVSSLTRYVEPNLAPIDPRLQTHEGGENNWCVTAMKTAAVIATIIVAIGSFVLLGPLVGLVVTLVIGLPALLIFNSSRGHSHAHGGAPWFPFYPTYHVPVGRGDVLVGGGHARHYPPHDHAHGRGHPGPTRVPPPSGPYGHVPIGR